MDEEDVDVIRRWLDGLVEEQCAKQPDIVEREANIAAALRQADVHLKTDTNGHVVEAYCYGQSQGADADRIAVLASQLPELRVIDFSTMPLTNHGMRALSNCAVLEKLNIRDTCVTGTGLRSLRGISTLRTLVWTPAREQLDGSEHLGNLRQLTSLSLHGAIGDTEARCLPSLQELRELDLGATQISSLTLSQLKELPKLQKLHLAETTIEGGLSHLEALKALSDLDVESTGIADACLADIARCTCLESLSVSDCRVGDEGVGYLRVLPKLSCLHISGTLVSDASLTAMRRFPALSEVWLFKTATTREAIQRFLLEVKSCSVYAEDTKIV